MYYTHVYFLAPSSGGDASSKSGLENNTIKQLFSSLFSNLQHMVTAILFMDCIVHWVVYLDVMVISYKLV